MESLPNSLLTEINAVSRMDSQALRARYGHFFGENSTRSTASLRSEIIYKLKERHYRKSVGTETMYRYRAANAVQGGGKRHEAREPTARGRGSHVLWFCNAAHRLLFWCAPFVALLRTICCFGAGLK